MEGVAVIRVKALMHVGMGAMAEHEQRWLGVLRICSVVAWGPNVCVRRRIEEQGSRQGWFVHAIGAKA